MQSTKNPPPDKESRYCKYFNELKPPYGTVIRRHSNINFLNSKRIINYILPMESISNIINHTHFTMMVVSAIVVSAQLSSHV